MIPFLFVLLTIPEDDFFHIRSIFLCVHSPTFRALRLTAWSGLSSLNGTGEH